MQHNREDKCTRDVWGKKKKALVWMENKRETELMTFYNKNIKAYLAADG